jgi:fructose-bisphosphate aldolase class II
MALVTSKEMFQKAYEGKYAVGAFNVNNMEIVQGIVDAAKVEKAPLILQVSAGARKYAKHIYLMKLVEAAMEDSGLDICLHLDHGEDFEICKSCIDGGFSSVMIDGSKFPFEENIELTRRVVEYAHERGVVVEAELGRLAGVEDAVKVAAKDASYTDPDQAVEFVERTGVDSLAIAIGTSHGAYKFAGEPSLDFARLEKISNMLPNFPLVLHGASTVLPEFVAKCNQFGGQLKGAQGVPEDMLLQAGKLGVCKINIDTDLRLAMTASIREHFMTNPEHFDPRQYLKPAREAIQAMVQH